MQITAAPLPTIGMHLFVIIALSFLAAYVWQYRKIPGVPLYSAGLLLKVTWLASVVLNNESTGPAWQALWYKAAFLAGSAVVPVWFAFLLQVTGQESWLTGRRLAAILIIPAVYILIVFTNEWHGWYAQRQSLHWLFQAYNYVLVAACYYINIGWIRREKGLRRRQALAMAIAPPISIAGQFLNIYLQWAFAPLLLPLGFFLASLIWFWALLYLRVLNIIPIAKDTVIDNMSDGFVVVDDEGYVYELNPAAAATLGVAEFQALRHKAEDVFAVWPALLEVLHGREAEELEAAVEGADGNRFYELHGSPLFDRGGRFLGKAIIWHDVTERHLAHEQLKIMEESRRRLLANISHDLRTPVSSVLGHAELLLEDITESPDQQRTYLKRIHAKMLGFNRLIQDLFELAKIESKQGLFRLADIPAAAVIENVYEKYLFDVQRAGIRFERNIAVAADIMVSADADRLEQIFANLISNSIRYTEQGGTIVLGCELTDNRRPGLRGRGGRAVLFKVIDDGIGIAPEHIRQVFERFYRASEVREASSEHSGLGLAIAKEIAVAHGGHIWVDASVTRGCTVCFTLPVAGD